jgi:hypothetical protein
MRRSIEEPSLTGPDDDYMDIDDRFNSTGETEVRVVDDSNDTASKPLSASGKYTNAVRNLTLPKHAADSTLFRLDEPVVNFTHKIATINELQWPENFCVNMDFLAPIMDRIQKERCIVLLGGREDHCGLFNIYIDERNQVGMGMTCQGDDETYATTGDSPLITRWENNSIVAGHLYNLSFCYDTTTGAASIWESGKLYIRGRKVWNFPRKGYVSVFVGSHVSTIGGFAIHALNWEDSAKLYQIYITENATTTTTTSWTIRRTTTEHLIEVDLNASEATGDMPMAVMRTTTPLLALESSSTSSTPSTSPRPKLFHSNTDSTITNNTQVVETKTEKTVTTDTFANDRDTHGEKVIVPVVAPNSTRR